MGPVAYFSLCLLGCLIFNPSLEGARAASCPRGWLHFQDDCYGYFPQEATWRRAEEVRRSRAFGIPADKLLPKPRDRRTSRRHAAKGSLTATLMATGTPPPAARRPRHALDALVPGAAPESSKQAGFQARCQSYSSGAHLASIHSEEEHNAVAGFIARSQRRDDDDDDGDDVWIGLHIPARSRRWSWADGSELDFSAWDSHRSYFSLKGEHCVVLEEDTGFMTWDNDSCNDRNPFVCKYRP